MSRDTDPLQGWPHDESPFHQGEQEVQTRVGVRDKLEQVGGRLFRGAMPDEHRELFEKLPFVVVGGLDAARRPWASILTGAPGFVHTPNAETLTIAARPGDDDALGAALDPGAPIALLGIEPSTRRRNRVNGVVTDAGANRIALRVQQSFGNCPKYIHPRHLVPASPHAGVGSQLGPHLPPAAAALVRQADTFFIASASAAAGLPHATVSDGVDVSHRGGPAGFVQITEDTDHTVLTVPDYVGNFFFNTLGNLRQNPNAGLLFLDFDSGDLLQLSARVEIVWDGPAVEAIPGARRLLRFHLAEGRWRPGTMPLRRV